MIGDRDIKVPGPDGKNRKKYDASFKVQIALEAVKDEKNNLRGEIASTKYTIRRLQNQSVSQ